MPRYLGLYAIQRLEASQYALHSALLLLGVPKPVDAPARPTDRAIEVGLIGTSAELALTACLYEVAGESGVLKQNGAFLTAGEALANFRQLLGSNAPKLALLTEGVSDPGKHLEDLRSATKSFRPLFTARAGGLHAGSGVSSDVALTAASDVSGFLATLAKGTRFRPYLKEIPALPREPVRRMLLAEELSRQLEAGSQVDIAMALKSIFIVLPDLAKDEPSWIASLDRVAVCPKRPDVTVLLKSLQEAKVAEIVKVGKGLGVLAARIDPTDPNALPIDFTFAKKSYTQPLERWKALIGTANGHIERGVLALPNIQSLYEFFSLGVDRIGLPLEELQPGLVAQDLWPFVAAALSYQGNPGPCFFLVRRIRVSEVGQLMSLLHNAAKLSKRLEKAISEYQPLLKSAAESKPMTSTSEIGVKLRNEFSNRLENRFTLLESLEQQLNPTKFPAHKEILSAIRDANGISLCLARAAKNELNCSLPETRSIFRRLISVVTEKDEVPSLVQLLLSGGARLLSSDMRKALRVVDFANYGPEVQTPTTKHPSKV